MGACRACAEASYSLVNKDSGTHFAYKCVFDSHERGIDGAMGIDSESSTPQSRVKIYFSADWKSLTLRAMRRKCVEFRKRLRVC